MNSAVVPSSDLPILPTDPTRPTQPTAVPVVLTACTFFRGRSDIIARLCQENFDLRYADQLPEAIDPIRPDVVLVDMDAADFFYDGLQNLSGYRLVTVLLRQLAHSPIAVVVMTTLDFAEINELARGGVDAIVSPDISSQDFVEQVRSALHHARRRYGHLLSKRCDTPPSAPAVDSRLTSELLLKSVEVDDGWRLPDQLWHKIEELLPPAKHHERTRPVDRRAVDAILFVLRSGFPWSRLPKSLGSPVTARERVLKWSACGIMEEILAAGLDTDVDWERLYWDRLAPAYSPPVIARRDSTSEEAVLSTLHPPSAIYCQEKECLTHEAGHVYPNA
jgi:transposase